MLITRLIHPLGKVWYTNLKQFLNCWHQGPWDAVIKGQAVGSTTDFISLGREMFMLEEGPREDISLSTIWETHKGFHYIWLNVKARSDIYWCFTFIQLWNGISLLRELGKEEIDHYVTTDASSQVGCGSPWHNRWFQIWWPLGYCITKNLPLKDSIMLPVVISAAVWGQSGAVL